ncbi:acyl-CoA dehydrogenase family protein [Streptomyces violaceusniger]|uniref:Acyl-CoA dehydrogenase n=1 Tax=Streptomyces violaceusniger TaxID=68280 RepID=A0A4D4LLL3_STRVO|nr:acyl-CoA dehydrogenase [Streptomyces violaceusniger]
MTTLTQIEPAQDDIREEFRASVRGVLRDTAPVHGPRAVWSAESVDADAFRQAADLGWLGLLVTERWGGAGAGMQEVVVVAEELGAHLAVVPFLSSAVLTCTALAIGGDAAMGARWLPGLASGQLRGAVALTGPAGRTDPELLDVRAREEGGQTVLDGKAGFVLDGADADLVLVAARRTGRPGADLYAVPRGTPGVEAAPQLCVDRTRRLCTLVLNDVRLDASARLPYTSEAWPVLADRAAVALAADAVGAARRALDMAVEYAKQREQFGRPIGSFQAIKHKLADMYLLVRGASLAVEAAAAALDEGRGARRLVSLAGAYAGDAAAKVTGDAIQVHGGIGYTWEHDCHRLFKRATFDEVYLGDPSAHRERVAGLLLDGQGPSTVFHQ